MFYKRAVLPMIVIAVVLSAAGFGGASHTRKQFKTPDHVSGFTGGAKAPANVSDPAPVLPEFNGTIRSPDEYAGLALPFRNDLYDLTTVFLSAVGTDYLDLFAGALQSDPSTGVLVVNDQNAGGGTPSLASGAFTLPGTGYLTMTAVLGTVVGLTDHRGLPHAFDLVGDRFVS